MIQNRRDLKHYLAKDKYALGITRKRPFLVGDDIWKFERALRMHEYYRNTSHKHGVWKRVFLYYWKYRHYKLGVRLGFLIPTNVFQEGLRINHRGLIIVNSQARIGKFCDIHQGVNIGQNIEPHSVPVIGDNVYIGPGAKLFGKIKIGNKVMIGANSVVNKSFEEDNITIAGIPARKIKNTGDCYGRK